jgi:hypothetical protein
MTTLSYPLCVFLDSRKHGRLPVDHHFYRLVEEILHNVEDSPLILRYIAESTLAFQNEPHGDDVVEERRQEIVQYLKMNRPTVSGSDSPAMDSSTLQLVETRAYSGCDKDRKSRKLARKHIYIQKSLVDAWMGAYSKLQMSRDPNRRHGSYL